MTILYEIASLIMAVFIVLFSLITLYHGVRYLLTTKLKKQFDWIVLIQAMIALIWVAVFGYIAEESIRAVPPTVVGSFGNLFIRPVILVSSACMSIWMTIRYKFEKSGGQDRWNLQKK